MNQQIRQRILDILAKPPALVISAGITCLILALCCILFSKHVSYVSIWVVNAVLLIFILRSSPRLTWGYFFAGLIANFIANILTGGTILMSAAFAASNSFEILLPILFLYRQPDTVFILKGIDKQTIIFFVNIILGCLIASFLATNLTITLDNPSFFNVFFGWFTIDLLAMMSILPLGLSVTTERARKLLHPLKLLELIATAAITMIVVWLSAQYIQIKFIIILMPLLYAAFRLGLLGTSIVFFATVCMYIANNIMLGGTDTLYTTMSELISYRSLLMCITFIPAFTIATLIEQRDEFSEILQESEERFRGAIKYSATGMALVSPDGKWMVVNPAFCAITGYSENELKIMTYHEITHPDDLPANLALADKIKKREIPSFTIEKRYIKKGGSIIWVSVTASAVTDKNNRVLYYVTQATDITARKKMEEELKHQASHDNLTGLINRREAETKLGLLLNDARVARNTNSLFFIDLDNFKIVNDTAGHAAGDELLRKVSELLIESVRKTDIVARLGGDEFAVILPDCTLESASRLADTLIDNIKTFKFAWDNKVYEIGVSIGLVTFKPKETSLETILSHADIACYTAKNQGGNRVSIFKGNKSEASKFLAEIQLGPKIKRYIQDNLFRIYTQEIKPLKMSNDLHPYYEMLLRMHDERGNIILPATFFKSAERLDLLGEIDQWVIKQMLIENADKIRACHNFSFSINISHVSINSMRFHKTLDNYLSATSLDTSKIGFELKETAFINDVKSAQAFLQILVKHGCFVVMENFGKGLSSLQYLKNVPKLHIKIDGDLIRNMGNGPIEIAIVDSVNQLAHKLGAKTIAEYVESDTIIAKARELNIDYAQGYAIGQVIPLQRLITHLMMNHTNLD